MPKTSVKVHVIAHWYCPACHNHVEEARVPHLEQMVRCDVCRAQFVVQEVVR